MESNEIIKNDWEGPGCLNCPLKNDLENSKERLCNYAADIIDRKMLEKLDSITYQLKKYYEDLYKDALEYEKSEAVKEFAAKLKKAFLPLVCCDRIQFIMAEYEFDKLVKEMTGENKC